MNVFYPPLRQTFKIELRVAPTPLCIPFQTIAFKNPSRLREAFSQ